jgi:hypothetical protein
MVIVPFCFRLKLPFACCGASGQLASDNRRVIVNYNTTSQASLILSFFVPEAVRWELALEQPTAYGF